MWARRDRASGRLGFVVHDVDLETDCRTRQNHEVHIKAMVSIRVDAAPLGTPGAPPAWRTPEQMYPLVRDIFIRELRAAVADRSWHEMLRTPRQLTDRTSAAAEPEMTALGLTAESFSLKAVDFPEGSEPALALRRAAAAVAAARACTAPPGEPGAPA
jgi:regulator of protease activity HflC (stomatin/prohibitin superfamily)